MLPDIEVPETIASAVAAPSEGTNCMGSPTGGLGVSCGSENEGSGIISTSLSTMTNGPVLTVALTSEMTQLETRNSPYAVALYKSHKALTVREVFD